MSGYLCTSWADETDEERGVDNIMEVEGMKGDEYHWEFTSRDDHNNDDDGSQTTSRRSAGRLD